MYLVLECQPCQFQVMEVQEPCTADGANTAWQRDRLVAACTPKLVDLVLEF